MSNASMFKRSERFLLAMSALLPSFLTISILTWQQAPRLRPGIIGFTATSLGFAVMYAEL